MTTALRGFWDEAGFKAFAPYLRTSKDGRAGQHARVELDSGTPRDVLASALAWTARCAYCGEAMFPFRARRAPSKRGDSIGAVYLGTTCPNRVSPGCSRSTAAAAALAALGNALSHPVAEPAQSSWLDAFGGPAAPARSWH